MWWGGLGVVAAGLRRRPRRAPAHRARRDERRRHRGGRGNGALVVTAGRQPSAPSRPVGSLLPAVGGPPAAALRRQQGTQALGRSRRGLVGRRLVGRGPRTGPLVGCRVPAPAERPARARPPGRPGARARSQARDAVPACATERAGDPASARRDRAIATGHSSAAASRNQPASESTRPPGPQVVGVERGAGVDLAPAAGDLGHAGEQGAVGLARLVLGAVRQVGQRRAPRDLRAVGVDDARADRVRARRRRPASRRRRCRRRPARGGTSEAVRSGPVTRASPRCPRGRTRRPHGHPQHAVLTTCGQPARAVAARGRCP